MAKFSLPVRVYYEDTDAGGIVYYVNYLKFMERARTEWLRSLGFLQAQLEVQFVVKSAQVSYLSPAYLDDELEVRLEITNYQGARIVFQQEIAKQGHILCQGLVEVVCVTRQDLRPCRLPETLVAALPDLTK